MDTRLPIRGLGLCSSRAKRPFFREILGVKVRVNLLAEVLREAGEKEENGNARLRYNAAQQLFNGNEEWNSQSRQGDRVEQLSPRVFPFSRPQPRKPRKLPPNGKSFFRTLKREEVDAREFRDLEELRLTHYSISSIAITTKKDFTRLSDIGPGENSSG
jgi:hypothetical protein